MQLSDAEMLIKLLKKKIAKTQKKLQYSVTKMFYYRIFQNRYTGKASSAKAAEIDAITGVAKLGTIRQECRNAYPYPFQEGNQRPLA